MQRHLVKKVKGMPASDGAGVKLKRVIGQPQLGELDQKRPNSCNKIH